MTSVCGIFYFYKAYSPTSCPFDKVIQEPCALENLSLWYGYLLQILILRIIMQCPLYHQYNPTWTVSDIFLDQWIFYSPCNSCLFLNVCVHNSLIKACIYDILVSIGVEPQLFIQEAEWYWTVCKLLLEQWWFYFTYGFCIPFMLQLKPSGLV